MSDGSPSEKWAVCTCNTCSGHLEFDPSNAGTTIRCPHCGVDTVLFVPSASATSIPNLSVGGGLQPTGAGEKMKLRELIAWFLAAATGVALSIAEAHNRKVAAERDQLNRRMTEEARLADSWQTVAQQNERLLSESLGQFEEATNKFWKLKGDFDRLVDLYDAQAAHYGFRSAQGAPP
jgi:hypothetical protein